MAKFYVEILILVYFFGNVHSQNWRKLARYNGIPIHQSPDKFHGELPRKPFSKSFDTQFPNQFNNQWPLELGQFHDFLGTQFYKPWEQKPDIPKSEQYQPPYTGSQNKSQPGSNISWIPLQEAVEGMESFDIDEEVRSRYDALFPKTGSSPQADTNPVYQLPDLSYISSMVQKSGFFSSFSPVHAEALRIVAGFLQGANSTIEMLDIAKALRQSPHINIHLWYFAFSIVANRNPELARMHRLSPIDALPHLFIDSATLAEARNSEQQTCVVSDENVGTDNGIENRLWYFREHLGINAHHWYYHIIYPLSAPARQDRHGELFYYLHASMLSRYNAERLSNGLSRIGPLQPLQVGLRLQGYNPHLTNDVSGINWTPRPANLPLSDLIDENNPDLGLNIYVNTTIVQSWRRILEAIRNGFLVNRRNQTVRLNNLRGIDVLSDVVQANILSVNPNYYGSGSASGLHNNGHTLLAYQADPRNIQMLPPGVIGDTATSMRDVIFYEWHEVIEEVYLAHKITLTPYTPTGGELPLVWPGVRVTGISLTTTQSGTINQVNTFWGQQSIRIGRTLDFLSERSAQPILVCAKQLDHQAFTYNIGINNSYNTAVNGTVRIFLAPRFDERGNRWSMTNQRRLFFVLDTYGVRLNPGLNNLRRMSIDSTLTVPWAQQLQEVNSDPDFNTPRCGCGWPQNMLLPKGTAAGMIFDLFVMVTNRNEDTVPGQDTPGPCRPAYIYCGITGQLYPDAKPMGYPFDRLPYSVNRRVVANLDEYIRPVPNMATTQIQIRFTG